MSSCEVRDLGLMPYGEALKIQQELVEQRKQGLISDQLLFVEHPHVITLGRNGHLENLLADEETLRHAGVEFHETNRGGDITYHGPGQITAYPILDLREWKRDVLAYIRALESVLIETLRFFRLDADRVPGATGVWVNGAKAAAIGVHISRWVTYHGFALNVTTDLAYFRYIVPCGLQKPVTSMAELGCTASRAEVTEVLMREFSRQFERGIVNTQLQPAYAGLAHI